MSFKIEIRHKIKGRFRVKIKSLRRNQELSDKLCEVFLQIAGINNVRTNPRCNSFIIKYEAEFINTSDLLSEMYKKGVKFLTETSPVKIISKKSELLPSLKVPSKISSRMLRFMGLSLISGIVMIRKYLFKLAIYESFFSPLGLVVALATIPLIRDAAKEVRETKKITLHSFLGGSCLLAVILGEAMTALEILWITEGAELLTDAITERSRKSISKILKISEKNTFILRDGVEVEVTTESLKIGDVLVLHTGEKIPADAKIIKGHARLNEAPFTGNAIPVLKKQGDTVLAGAIVDEGLIHAEVKRVGDGTYLAHILRQVESTLENRAPVEVTADRLANKLIKIGFASTALTLLLTGSLMRAFTVMLVMACPCATVLAASSAVGAALSAAAKRGILIKGGCYLEKIGLTDLFCFDKTGTLTNHEPELCEIACFHNEDKLEVLKLALSAELHNQHPLAQAIRHEAETHGLKPYPHVECDFIHGRGVKAKLKDGEVLIGSLSFMKESKLDMKEYASTGDEMAKHGMMTAYVAFNKKPLGVLAFENRLRPALESTFEKLRKDGVEHLFMLTGDSQYAAEFISEKLGFEKCYHSLLPEGKEQIINELKQQQRTITMLGDGINDGPALALADIGIAMGIGGSDVAIEAADIVLINDRLEELVILRKLSHRTIKIANENFMIATGTNIIGAIMGAAGIIHPIAAGALHIIHTLGILANSARLLHIPKERDSLFQLPEESNRVIYIDEENKPIKELTMQQTT